MRRRLLEAVVFGVILFGGATHAFAQGQEKEPENTLAPWRVANTVIFAVLVGYLIAKSAPKFFNARTADIQKAIKDATGLKLDAELRYSEADRRIASLAQEIQRMRDEYAQELEREHQRVRRDTEHQIDRMRQNVGNEIEAFRKDGMRQVRRRIAQAAITRAEQRLRERAGNTEDEALVQDFVHAVERGPK